MIGAAVRWLPAVATYAAIYWFSDQPTWPRVVVGYPDWLLHGAAYAALAVAIWFGCGGERHRPLTTTGVLTAIVIAILAGALDEYHQGFVQGRDASLGDVGADAVGAAIGVVAAQWAAFAGTRRAWENRSE
jgi:VanZ family protein